MYDNKTATLYVNDNVPIDDVDKFVLIAGYDGNYINDPDCEIANVIDDVYKQYGGGVWQILIGFYNDRRKEREDVTAAQKAAVLYEIINGYERNEDMPDVFFDKERLIYHLGQLAGKEGRRTVENLISYSTKYAFLLGYFMGNGAIRTEAIA